MLNRRSFSKAMGATLALAPVSSAVFNVSIEKIALRTQLAGIPAHYRGAVVSWQNELFEHLSVPNKFAVIERLTTPAKGFTEFRSKQAVQYVNRAGNPVTVRCVKGRMIIHIGQS